MIRRLRVPALLALLAYAGCTNHNLRKDTSVCSESRELRCATVPECAMNEARHCKVCSCTPAGPLPDPERPPEPPLGPAAPRVH